jgi:colanic acid/amylovoran biosynthesis glycosyltransferase
MKILMVVPGFPRLSETFIVNKYLGLLARGHDVHVHCASSDETEWARLPALADREHRRRVHVAWPADHRAVLLAPAALASAAGKNPRGTLGFLRQDLSPRHFYQHARVVELAPDIVHFEFGGLAVDGIALKQRLGVRVVVSFRGADICFSGLDRPGHYDRVFHEADALHFLGQDLWQRARQRGCPENVRHAFIAPAIDVARFLGIDRAPAGIVGTPARPLRLLSVGRLHWKKGHEHAIAAVALLRDQGLHAELRIVGGGEHMRQVVFARHQLGLTEQVQILGARPPAEIDAELARADVFVHAAVSEGFCNAVIEAQAAGLPVVTSDAEGLAENIEDGVTGFLVARREPAAMATKLAQLARSPELRHRMGENGRARARSRYRLDAQMDAFDALYRDVMGHAAN